MTPGSSPGVGELGAQESARDHARVEYGCAGSDQRFGQVTAAPLASVQL